MLCVCLLAAWLLPATHSDPNLNTTQQEHGTFSAEFGFNLSGVRSFSPEQDLETRIIGGQEAWAHSWPWQVSLCYVSTPACGGAVITPLWVVSAAHCFKRYNKAPFWTVLAGKHDLDDPNEPGQQLVGVSLIESHPGYDTRTKANDVALLKLQQPLTFNTFVRPIDVWMAPLPTLQSCTITGWGSSRENGARVNRLQEVNVTILPSDVCNKYYTSGILPSMFCAGKDEGGVDACQGDSGGPLSCFTGSRYELAGLVSWGVGCGRARKPGVYTQVQQHTQWIADIMHAQNDQYTDDLTATESRCGKQHNISCEQFPVLAVVSVSEDDEASLENVTEACPFLWPWQVSLQAANGRHYCSGALIHRSWVLTAQHCNVRAKKDMVVLGVHDLRFSSSETVPVDKVFNLPKDRSFPPKSDLSLLRLAVPATFSPDVSPVCVPEKDEDLDSSWSCVTTGWRTSSTAADVDRHRLHNVGLTLVNQTSCSQKWGGGFITNSYICSHPGGSTSCMGDSGALLVCRKHGAYFLFGVVTWGSRQCDAEKPAVFSRVSEYHRWITEVTQDV
ncbi:ovochymase-1 isoform X2 [Sander lucioperca]|uniref:ovochymase-1 isoform X2 n=1 Tax=Sander lucioperca TaxID=283035 RepID=UPI00125E8AD9|nr:ovochymase-1 isoform X2 [Sander lucioperca]